MSFKTNYLVLYYFNYLVICNESTCGCVPIDSYCEWVRVNLTVHLWTPLQWWAASRERDIAVLTEIAHGTTNLSLRLAVIIPFSLTAQAALWAGARHFFFFFFVPEFDQDGGTMRGTINVIYSCHHSCCSNPTFNTLTYMKAVWIPTACPLMHISVCTHTVHIWKHTIFTHIYLLVCVNAHMHTHTTHKQRTAQ